MPVPSWNLAIAVIFVMGISFGYILQRDKIIATLLSVYVGLIMTQALSGTMQQFFEGSKTFNQFWINLHASPFSIRSAIFMLTITLLTAKAGISGGITTGLILSSLFNFMPADSRAAFVENSKFAAILINDYTWWVITPVLVLIGMGFFRKSAD